MLRIAPAFEDDDAESEAPAATASWNGPGLAQEEDVGDSGKYAAQGEEYEEAAEKPREGLEAWHVGGRGEG